MITSKQRAKLRAIANKIDTILHIGKDGINENLILQAKDALKAREIIKVKTLENAPAFAKDMAMELAVATNSDIVQVIGTRFVLYKRNEKNPQIDLGK